LVPPPAGAGVAYDDLVAGRRGGVAKDELDEGILDNVSMAGMRFDRMLKMLREKK